MMQVAVATGNETFIGFDSRWPVLALWRVSCSTLGLGEIEIEIEA